MSGHAVTDIFRRLTVGGAHYLAVARVARFLPRKLAYEARLRGHRPSPAAGAAGYADTLAADGVVVIPDFIDEATVARMRLAVPELSSFRESPEGERSYYFPEAQKIADFAPFFESSVVRAVAHRCVSGAAMPLRRTVGVKNVIGEVGSFELFHHMDTWKRRMKAFLYLNDVGAEQAPMRYVKGSHRGWWRLPMEATIAQMYGVDQSGYARPEDFYIGCYWPHEVRRLSQAYGLEEITCVGGAGTLIIFDARGLHRATALREGNRTILMSYWTHPGDHT